LNEITNYLTNSKGSTSSQEIERDFIANPVK